MSKVSILEREDGTGYLMVFIAEDAEALAVGNGASGNSDDDANKRNAYAHAHTSAWLTTVTSAGYAEINGDVKENKTSPTTGVDSQDEYRDQYNNEIGRRVGDWLEDWLEAEAAQGRTYSDAQKEKFLDDLIVDADKSNSLISDPLDDDRMIGFDDSQENYQNPKSDVDWQAPTSNWQGQAQDRDYSKSDDFWENPIGVGLYAPIILPAEIAQELLGDLFNSLEDLLQLLGEPPETPSSLPLGFLPEWLAPLGGVNGGGSVLTGAPSPLVLDVDADGIEVSNLWGGAPSTTYFDMDNDGFAERTAWIKGGDGLLAMDRNNNGTIDNKGELFGDTAPYADGFAALKALDSNADNKITSADTDFTKLRVWIDADSDGVTDAGELKTLAQLNITSIGLTVAAPAQSYNNDNWVSGASTFTMNGVTRTVEDVWFRVDQADTRFTGDYTFDVRTLFLPTLRGFGTMKDLHVAMSGDETLLDLVQDFVVEWDVSRLADMAALDQDVTNILNRWAGIDGVAENTTSYGMSAHQFLFVEKFLGQKPSWWSAADPVGSTGEVATTIKVYTDIFSTLKSMLLLQAGADTLFEGAGYNLATGEIISGVLTQGGVDALEALEATAGSNYWNDVTSFLLNVKPLQNFTAAEISMLDLAAPVQGGQVWHQYAANYAGGFSYWIGGTDRSDNIMGSNVYANTIDPGAGNDIVHGGLSADTLRTSDGDDQLYGHEGDDLITDNSGNNLFVGGAGNDTLAGGSGTDTAVFSGVNTSYTISGSTVTDNVGTDGVDTLSGIERLQFTNGIYQSGVFTPYSSDDILIGTSVAQAFDGGGGLDTVNYSNSTAAVNIDLASASAATGGYAQGDTFVSIESLVGSAYNDQLRGNAANEIFYGGNGNDTLKGLDGNDTLYGDAGVDTLEGNNGNDTLYGGAGADSLKGGSGVDKFVYLSASEVGDTILDFSVSSGEKIDLTAVLQNSAGFVGTQAFTAGYLRVVQSGANTNVYLDVDGSAGSGAEVLLATLQSITSSTITLSSFILPTSVAANTAPVAVNDSKTTNEDTATIISVLSNDSDANGDTLTVSVLTNGAKGSLVVNSDKTITYTPNANTNGSDSFTYQINDGHGGTASATVSLTVTAVNDAPIAFDDVFNGMQNTNITGNLLSNNGNGADSDIDGDTLSVTAQTLTTAHGSVVISANGNFTYTPTTGYTGTDSFNYTLSDGQGGSDTGAVSLTLSAGSGIYGTTGNDTITGTANNDTIYGLAGNDTLYGEAGNDTLYGDAGTDTLKGRDGNDIMYGGADVDYLEGGNGDDVLYGGAGADTLKGSAGVDTFVFQSMSDAGDTIQDYNYSAGEKLNIANILTLYHPLTDAITDFVQITQSGTDSILSIDVDGGANSFVQLATLTATSGLTDEAALVSSGRLLVA